MFQMYKYLLLLIQKSQQDAHVTEFILSDDCSTYLGYHYHPSWYSSSRVRTRPKPSNFQGEKILSTPSFRGEVKPSVPCHSFTACGRSLNVTWKSAFRQNYRTFLAHSSTFRRWVLSRGDMRGDAWWRKLERLTQIAQ